MLFVRTFVDPGTDVMKGPRKWVLVLLCVMASFLVFFVLWANFAKLDVTVFGMGKVVPSAQLQVVQNLEGGIISKILVQRGERVRKGQTLLKIDPTSFEADLQEKRANYLALLAQTQRLRAEAEGKELVFSDDLKNMTDITDREKQLFRERKEELASNMAVLQQQLEQKQLALQELITKINFQRRVVTNTRREVELNRPLLKSGSISEVEFLTLENQLNSLDGELKTLEVSQGRVQAEINEARARIADRTNAFQAEALGQYNETSRQLESLRESLKGEEDRVRRREVKSPVDGVVNRVLITTIGGISKPGDDLVEIVPSEDNLLIEMVVQPKDIGFLTEGQKATVRFTAYDSSVFGSLDGKVTKVGADTLQDERGNTFYHVIIRTEQNYMGKADDPMPIIPGMEATIHVTTGERTIMDYILKPIVKLREQAFRER